MYDMILQYEKDFFSKEFCNNISNLETRLSQEFLEYGYSGNIFSRDDIIKGLIDLNSDRNIDITQFQLSFLCENIVLVNYISCCNNEQVLRTSIWMYEDNNWRMRFHQGTPYTTVQAEQNRCRSKKG